MINETKSAVAKEARITWPDLSKDTRATELAKVAMGWAAMTVDQQMENASALLNRAQAIKETL